MNFKPLWGGKAIKPCTQQVCFQSGIEKVSVITQFIAAKKCKHEFNQKVTTVEVSTDVKEECREFGAPSQSAIK